MLEAVTNTSPLVYLFHLDGLPWLESLFTRIWLPTAVVVELETGIQEGYELPDVSQYPFLEMVEPEVVPSEWLVRDLGAGELAAMALALEKPEAVVLLDDRLARDIAKASGLQVWGTLRVLLEAKERELIAEIKPLVERLRDHGFWLSAQMEGRILRLAGEN